MKRMAMLQHPLIVIDVEGFFRPLEALLTHLIATGFMSEAQRSLYKVVADRRLHCGRWGVVVS